MDLRGQELHRGQAEGRSLDLRRRWGPLRRLFWAAVVWAKSDLCMMCNAQCNGKTTCLCILHTILQCCAKAILYHHTIHNIPNFFRKTCLCTSFFHPVSRERHRPPPQTGSESKAPSDLVEVLGVAADGEIPGMHLVGVSETPMRPGQGLPLCLKGNDDI